MSTAWKLFTPPTLLFAGVLLVSGIREQYLVQPAKPLATIPSTMMGLQGRDVVIDTLEQRIAGMSSYALRQFYADSVEKFSTYVGYYDRQVQGKTIHSPKNCLPGAGWEILTSQRIPSPDGAPGSTVNRVLLSNRGTRALVYYWYQGRGRVEASEYKVKWNLLRDAAVYGRTEEALVRIVVPVERNGTGMPRSDDPAVVAADKIARAVALELRPAVQQVLPSAPGA